MWKDDGVEKKRNENYDGEVQAIFALSVANVNANWQRVKRIALWELRANRRLPFATSLAMLINSRKNATTMPFINEFGTMQQIQIYPEFTVKYFKRLFHKIKQKLL
ncbi:hypothetical protein CEXT_14751 [Caerostris extrusa]|uniref:Uncharacterized protein n=1 Tax=Caerostris extrusa TaxID=172846 RepID=A0AAV4SIM4_CAEEX|nr:hypothetical protein CEXT_14751 [Caerostris extrusa]